MKLSQCNTFLMNYVKMMMSSNDIQHSRQVEVTTCDDSYLPLPHGSVDNLSQSCMQTGINHDIISPPKQQPVSLTEVRDRANRIKKKLFVTKEETESIEKNTREQSSCSLWFEHRISRITASQCKRALLRKGTSPKKALAEILHYKNRKATAYMKDGIEPERVVLERYSKKRGVEVKRSGLFISVSHPFLAASPDGIVGEDPLAEVKKVHPKENEGLSEVLGRKRICKKNDKGALTLNQTHCCYYQVQEQLFCSGTKCEDFVASDGQSLFIDNVQYNKAFWEKNLPQLQAFFFDNILLEMAYPRVRYGLECLSKLGITFESLEEM